VVWSWSEYSTVRRMRRESEAVCALSHRKTRYGPHVCRLRSDPVRIFALSFLGLDESLLGECPSV